MAKEYQGSATGGSYSPNKTIRTAGGSTENDNRILSSLNDYNEITNMNNREAIKAAEKQTRGFNDLAKFSEKLTNKLVKDQQARNLEEYEAGIAEAYANGIPKAEAEAFDKEEAAVNAVGMETDALGAEYAAASGSEALGQRISSSSGWRALGRATGMAKQGAAQYGMHMAVNANRLAETTSPEEYAATLAEIRKEYTGRFQGMNRAMMAKYMFPKMHEVENQAFLGWQQKNNELIRNDRISEMGDTFYAEVTNGKGGQAAVDFITKNRAFLGGWGKARAKLFEIIDEGIKNDTISPDDLEEMRNQPYVFNGRQTTLGAQFKKDFDASRQKFINQRNQRFTNEENDRKIKANEILKNVREYQAQLGRKMTDDEKKRLNAEWDPRLGPLPNELKNMMTMEDVEEQAIVDRVEAKLEAGYSITEQDLEGLPLRTRQQYQNAVKGAGGAKAAESYVKALVSQAREETDGDKAKTPMWEQMNANAQSYFKKRYNQALKEGLEPTDALNAAKAEVKAAIDSGLINTNIPTNNGAKTSQARATALGALEESPDIWRTTVIPGTQDTLKQLQEEIQQQQQTGGTPTIPQLYHTLAAGMKNVSGWDLADQQLQLNGGTGLIKPQAEQYIDGLSDDTIKQWMTYKPTPSRAVRTMTATGDAAPFLELVAGVESRGDYNAFNLGGTAGGHVAHGSGFGDAATKRWGRQLTDMTVGEVMEIGASPSSENRWVHAAGKYQIIPSTLRGLVKNYGIDTNAPFDEVMQDQLALYLAYGRLVQGNKINGLRNEWIGLNHVGADQIQASLGAAFNNPQLLLKGV